MVGVAVLAVGAVVQTAVNAGFGLALFGNIGVAAFAAQGVYASPGHMALAALIFDDGVVGDTADLGVLRLYGR